MNQFMKKQLEETEEISIYHKQVAKLEQGVMMPWGNTDRRIIKGYR